MPPQPLLRRIDHLIHDIARRHALRFDRAAAGRVGLSGAQLRLAAVLQEVPPDQGLAQCAIAHRLGLTEMAVAALCARMEKAGWVARAASPVDRRARLVRLTSAAHAELDQAFAVADALADDLLDGLSATDRDRLLDLLQRVHARLAEPPGPTASAPDAPHVAVAPTAAPGRRRRSVSLSDPRR